jgi:hypothetical protein
MLVLKQINFKHQLNTPNCAYVSSQDTARIPAENKLICSGEIS